MRLVFAPEEDIAFFGGDPDNFEYPRYDLDICFFRVYEDGKPAKMPHHLKWNPAGLKEDDLVFVAGNPGKTDRLNTVRHLEFIRDECCPRRSMCCGGARCSWSRSASGAPRTPGGPRTCCWISELPQGPAGRAGRLAGPRRDGPQAGGRKGIPAAAANSRAGRRLRRGQKTIDKSLAAWAADPHDYDLLERGQAFYSELFTIARTLVRLAEETAKPNADRLREYRESNLDSLKQELFSAGADLRRPANRALGRLVEHVPGAEGMRRDRQYRSGSRR